MRGENTPNAQGYIEALQEGLADLEDSNLRATIDNDGNIRISMDSSLESSQAVENLKNELGIQLDDRGGFNYTIAKDNIPALIADDFANDVAAQVARAKETAAESRRQMSQQQEERTEYSPISAAPQEIDGDLLPFHAALVSADPLETMRNINNLVKEGKDIDAVNENGRTAFHVAVIMGDVNAMNVLLARGADPNTMDKNGRTPFADALARGDAGVLSIFERNKDQLVEVFDEHGKNPLTYARERGEKELEKKLLQHGAIDRGNVDTHKINMKQAQEAVEASLVKKAVRSESEFQKKGDKEDGVSEGYVASDNRQNKTHMVKKGKKEASKVSVQNRMGIQTFQERDDQRDLVVEAAMAPVFKRLLGNDAPDIGIVVEGQELERDRLSQRPVRTDKGSTSVGLRSTFLGDDNFQTLSELTGAVSTTMRNSDELLNVKGAERVFAACIVGGEIDPHGANIGVVPAYSEGDGHYLQAKKIDHGRSGRNLANTGIYTFDMFRQALHQSGYSDDQIDYMVDPTELAVALEEMSKITEEEVRMMVSQQIYTLRDAGMTFENLQSTYDLPDAKPETVIEKLTANVMANARAAQLISQDLQRNHGVRLPEEHSTKAQKQAAAKGIQLEDSTKASQERDEKTAKLASNAYDLNKMLEEVLPAGTRFEVQDGNLALDLNGQDAEVGKIIANTLKKIGMKIDEVDGKFLVGNLNMSSVYTPDAEGKAELKGDINTAINKLHQKEFVAAEKQHQPATITKVTKSDIKDIQKSWGKAKTGFVAKVQGKANAFKIHPKTPAMDQLLKDMSKVIAESPEKAAQVEALVSGVQKGKLTKEGVQKGLNEIMDIPSNAEMKANLENELGLGSKGAAKGTSTLPSTSATTHRKKAAASKANATGTVR